LMICTGFDLVGPAVESGIVPIPMDQALKAWEV